MPRDTPLKKTLFACDELSGFVHACGLVRPTGLDGLEPKSVRKKLKQPSFAAGVHRDEVYAGAELLGLELDEHIANVVAALQPIASELGLRTAARRRRQEGCATGCETRAWAIGSGNGAAGVGCRLDRRRCGTVRCGNRVAGLRPARPAGLDRRGFTPAAPGRPAQARARPVRAAAPAA